MQKIKWIRLTSDLEFKSIRECLHQNLFIEDENVGFKVIDVSATSMDVQFFEKINVSEVVIGTNGEEENIVFWKIVSFYFSIIKCGVSGYLIRLDNPPRTLKGFSKKIVDVLGGAIDAMTIDLKRLIFLFEQDDHVSRLVINNVLIGDVKFTQESTSKIELSSSKDAYLQFKDHFFDIGHEIYRMRCSLSIDGISGVLEVSKTAMFNLDESVFDLIVDKLPHFILASLKNKTL